MNSALRFVVPALAGLFALSSLSAQTVNQWELRKKTSTGMQSYGITAVNGQAIGFSGGVPAMLSIGGTPAFADITGNATDNTSLAAALALKSPLASPTFTGTVTIPSGASITSPTIITGLTVQHAFVGINVQITPQLIGFNNTSTGAKSLSVGTMPGAGNTTALILPATSGTLISTGDTGTVTSDMLASGIALSKLDATGTADSTTYLRGDGTWQAISLSGYQTTTGTLALAGFSSITGTLPVANGGTGITALGTGIATFLGTPSSANLLAAITDETGTGLAVFATSPTLTTPRMAAIHDATVSQIAHITFPSAAETSFAQNANYLATATGASGYWGWRGAQTRLFSFADGSLDLARDANAQVLNVFNTYTSSTSYERLTLDWKTTANVARIGTEKGSGGGTARNLRLSTDTVIHATFETDGDVLLNYDELPTSDPVVKGQLWRSGTALQISAGP